MTTSRYPQFKSLPEPPPRVKAFGRDQTGAPYFLDFTGGNPFAERRPFSAFEGKPLEDIADLQIVLRFASLAECIWERLLLRRSREGNKWHLNRDAFSYAYWDGLAGVALLRVRAWKDVRIKCARALATETESYASALVGRGGAVR